MSDLKICRICLRTECKVYKYDLYQLKYFYEEVMASKIDVNDVYPNYFCYECATLLHKFHKFKEKCYTGQKVLRDLLWKGPITYQAIYEIDRQSQSLDSCLGIIMVSSRVKTYSMLDTVTSTDDEMDTDEFNNDNHIEFNDDDNTEFNKDNDDIPFNNEISDYDNKETKHDLNFKEVDTLAPNGDILDNDIQLISIKSEKRDIDDECHRYKFEAELKVKNLSNEHWKRINLSEEEAVNEFRGRAKNSKFLKAQFKCILCFRGFSKNEMLKRHHQLKHAESAGPVECRFCKMRFTHNCYLAKHLRTHYNKYQCLRCDLVCNLEQTALLHDEYHSGILRKCVFCNEEFKHMSTYYSHLRTHRSKFVCTLCGVSFVSNTGLHQHKKRKHVLDEITHSHLRTHRSKFVGTLCGISFVSKTGLHHHKKRKHVLDEIDSPDDFEDLNTYCDRCDIRFETRKAYEEHLFHSTMHIEGDEPAEIKKKILGKKSKAKITNTLRKTNPDESLLGLSHPRKRARRNRRMRRKPTTCHQCGQHFATQQACMKHHKEVHPRTSFYSNNERAICEICGASLAPGSVITHMNMHSREKMHPCSYCDKSFHASCSLKRHLVTHTGEKRFPCSVCGKRFTQSNSMKLHYRTVHLKQPYPKRNRRKKKDEPHSTMNDSKSDESDSLPEPEMGSMVGPKTGLEPVPNVPLDSGKHMEESVYLTLT